MAAPLLVSSSSNLKPLARLIEPSVTVVEGPPTASKWTVSAAISCGVSSGLLASLPQAGQTSHPLNKQKLAVTNIKAILIINMYRVSPMYLGGYVFPIIDNQLSIINSLIFLPAAVRRESCLISRLPLFSSRWFRNRIPAGQSSPHYPQHIRNSHDCPRLSAGRLSRYL